MHLSGTSARRRDCLIDPFDELLIEQDDLVARFQPVALVLLCDSSESLRWLPQDLVLSGFGAVTVRYPPRCSPTRSELAEPIVLPDLSQR